MVSGQFTALYDVLGDGSAGFGQYVGGLGDVNGDATPDFGVGNASHSGLGTSSGEVRVFSAGAPGFANYCTAGTSASGCQALLSGSGTAARDATGPVQPDGQRRRGQHGRMFLFGWNGRQALPGAMARATAASCRR